MDDAQGYAEAALVYSEISAQCAQPGTGCADP